MSAPYPEMIFIGHDGREAIATDVCEFSMRAHSSVPLFIQRLSEPALRHIGIYRREWYMMQTGQRADARDHKPFSTAFAFSRFLVPSLMQHQGWALFCDSDFLFRADVAQIFAAADPEKAVQVVKHGPLLDHGTKMDGQVQQPYFRKNWSSFALFNNSHPSNQRLAPHQVNTMPGQWLHAFSWLDDDEIGELDPAWNHLVGVDRPCENPKAVHFTLGIPAFKGHENVPFADEWRRYASACSDKDLRSI